MCEAAECEHQACIRLAFRHRLRCAAGRLDPASAQRYADVVSTLIRSQVTAEVLARLPSLELVATRSTG